MPIVVRHDVPAGIAALAGLMTGRGRAAVGEREALRTGGRQIVAQEAQAARQTQSLQAQRASQIRQIEAQADRQKEAADTAFARTALAAGLEENIQEQEFDNRMAGLQEQARVKANQFEYEFTTNQRNEIAKLNEGDQIMDDSRFSDADRNEWQRMKAQRLAGITPKPRPVDPNKPVYQEGRAPGQEFQDQGGNWHMVQPDGTTKMTLRRDQGQEAAAEKHQQAMELKELEVKMKAADTYRAAKLKLLMETVKEPVTGGEEGEEIEVPKYTPRGAKAFLERAGYTNPFEPEVQEAAAPGKADDWESGLRLIKAWSGNVERTEAEEGMPEPAAAAQAFLRYVKGKADRGEAISSAMRSVVGEAGKILSQYQGSP